MRYKTIIYIITLITMLLTGLLTLSHATVQAAPTTKHRVFIPAVVSTNILWSQEELAVMQLINGHRHAAGCPAVQPDRELGVAAKLHSGDMAAEDTLSHTGSDGSSYTERAEDAQYSFFASGEIIAAGYSTPKAVVDGWMNSAGHREIILTCQNTDIGVGAIINPDSQWRYYWTAVFGHR